MAIPAMVPVDTPPAGATVGSVVGSPLLLTGPVADCTTELSLEVLVAFGPVTETVARCEATGRLVDEADNLEEVAVAASKTDRSDECHRTWNAGAYDPEE